MKRPPIDWAAVFSKPKVEVVAPVIESSDGEVVIPPKPPQPPELRVISLGSKGEFSISFSEPVEIPEEL